LETEQDYSQVNTSFNLTKGKVLRTDEDYLTKITHKFRSEMNSLTENNAMRFSKYSERKDHSKWTLPILSYIEPKNGLEKIKGINFDKMKERNEADFYNGSTETPSICFYKPNFNFVLPNSPKGLKFNTKDTPTNKYLKLQKLWKSYEVGTEYKLVKFE